MNATPGMLNETQKRWRILLERKATYEWQDWLSILLSGESGDEGVRKWLWQKIRGLGQRKELGLRRIGVGNG